MKTISHNQSAKNTKIKAIILAGNRDFGKCSLASELPTPLWPVAGKPVLERLIVHLANQSIQQAVICSNDDNSLPADSIHLDNNLKVRFLNEELPVGTAGCIRDAADDGASTLLLVFSANMANPPEIDELIKAHNDGGSDLTMMFNPSDNNNGLIGEPADIYVFNPNVIEYIPKAGYFDVKEGLISKMLRAGKTIHTATLQNHAGNFRDRQSYLYAIGKYLENVPIQKTDLKHYKQNAQENVWMAASAEVEQGVLIYGPTILMDDAYVSKGTVIMGPSIIGRNVHLCEDSAIINSVLWDDSKIGRNCTIRQCIVDYNASVPGNTTVEEESISLKPVGVFNSIRRVVAAAKDNTKKLRFAAQIQISKINAIIPDRARPAKTTIVHLMAAVFTLCAFLWSYWPSFKDLWNVWQRNDEYSSGLLVPFLAGYILLSRRHDIARNPIKPAVFWGLFAFLIAQCSRFSGLFFMYGSAERLSIALSIAAIVLLIFGWKLFLKVSTILLFLCLMLPWPNRIQAAITLPMQQWATSSAVFCLEILGCEVFREGNIIHIGSATVAVAEACNGLRMVTAFFVISGLVVLLVERTWWEKLIILFSSLPIALLCNTIRLTATAIFFTVLKDEHWEKLFHDFGGYAMMPLALLIVIAELRLLTKLITLPPEEHAIIITRRTG